MTKQKLIEAYHEAILELYPVDEDPDEWLESVTVQEIEEQRWDDMIKMHDYLVESGRSETFIEEYLPQLALRAKRTFDVKLLEDKSKEHYESEWEQANPYKARGLRKSDFY